jgi:hypothetical protein
MLCVLSGFPVETLSRGSNLNPAEIRDELGHGTTRAAAFAAQRRFRPFRTRGCEHQDGGQECRCSMRW